MSSDYSPRKVNLPHTPHADFALRVEKLVMTLYGITSEEFWARKQMKRHIEARYIAWSILYQRNGFRSSKWMVKRYGRDRTSILYGLQQVNESPSLTALRTNIMDELVEELEFEAFGFRNGKAKSNDHHPRH